MNHLRSDDRNTKQTFDGLGRPLETILEGYAASGADFYTEDIEYDAYGRVEQKVHLPGTLSSINYSSIQYEPSPLDRPIAEIFPDNNSISTAYGNEGNYYKVTTTDENGNTSQSLTDIIGRTERTRDAKGNETIYTYDPRNNLTFVTNPEQQLYEYTYDVQNRMTTKKVPGAECQEFKYNVRDLVIASQDGEQRLDGNWVVNEYDVYGRIIKSGFFNPNLTSDPCSGQLTAPFVPLALEDDNLLIQNTYDISVIGNNACDDNYTPIGKLTQTRARILENGLLTGWSETSYCYDSYGREVYLEETSPVADDNYTNTYNLADQMTSYVREHDKGTSFTITQNNAFDFDRLTDVRFGVNGSSVKIAKNSYDGRDQLIGKKLHEYVYNDPVNQTSSYSYLQGLNYAYNSRGWLTNINQMPFKQTIPQYTCEKLPPPEPPIIDPPNDCAECGDEIVTLQELLKIRWEEELKVDCYVPCDCEERCSDPCDEGNQGGGTTGGETPGTPDGIELSLPTSLVEIKDCNDDTLFVLADSLIRVDEEYVVLQQVTLLSENDQFRVEALGVEQIVGLDGLLDLVSDRELDEVKTSIRNDCQECITNDPSCSSEEQTAQNNFLNSYPFISSAGQITFPSLLKRVRLCDGLEIYLFEEELNDLPGNYILLQTILVSNAFQELELVNVFGNVSIITLNQYISIRNLDGTENVNFYVPCDEQDCTQQTKTINASSVGESTHFVDEFQEILPYQGGTHILIHPGSPNSLVIDGVSWEIPNNLSTIGEVNYYLGNIGISSDWTVTNYEIKFAIPHVGGDVFNLYIGLFDGDEFIPFNGGNEYLNYKRINNNAPPPPSEIILEPDMLPTFDQMNNMRLVFLKYIEAGIYHIDGVSVEFEFVGNCPDPCLEEELECSTEENDAQQASLDTIEVIANQTPLSDIPLPTKLYRIKLCNGDEVYLLRHELKWLEGDYLILQSVDVKSLSQTHIIDRKGTPLDDLDANDLFALELHYYNGDPNISGSVGNGYGNGNIVTQYWQVADRDRQAYGYKYDKLDRITLAKYADIQEDNQYYNHGHYDVTIGSPLGIGGYDAIGNIQSITRQGPISECVGPNGEVLYSYGQIDKMTYDYNDDATQLESVTEESISRGFKATSTYDYDDNGNLIFDSGKGISTIEYNHLNLPYKVVFTTGEEIHWLYDAAGRKLQKTVFESSGSQSNQVDYVGGIEKDQQNGTYVYHDEGRVNISGHYAPDGSPIIPTMTYEYTIRDHLGNSRISFADLNYDGIITTKDNPETAEVEQVEILQENHYYPFGMNMEGAWQPQIGVKNAYQYNGKELNEDFGLDWNDYGARWYDAAIGRFATQDRFAEKYHPLSPYSYTANNPIKFIDVNGDSINVSSLLADDPDAWNTIKTDLESFTGLSLSVDESGNLSYTKPEGKLKGSKHARKNLIKAIKHKETVRVKNDEGGTGSHVPMGSESKELQNTVYINSEQIQGFIDGTSSDLDSRTYGFGMNFFHELGHTRVGGRKLDGEHGTAGVNVKNVNKIRRQLGSNFGKRAVYAQSRVSGDPGYEYFPFSRMAHKSLLKDKVPSSGYVRIPIK